MSETTPRGDAPVEPGTDAAPDLGTKLRLTFLSGTRRGSFVELGDSVFRLGRAAGCAVWTPDDAAVSQHHAKVVRLPDGYVLIDQESERGTFVNDQRLERARLRSGDVIRLGEGGPQIRVDVLNPDRAARGLQATVYIPNFGELVARRVSGVVVREIPLAGEPISIGRAESADLRLESPIVSKQHARIVPTSEGLVVEDLASSNGTWVSGSRVDRRTLVDGDRVIVGPFHLLVATIRGALALRVVDTRNRARLDARDLTVSLGGREVLHDISLAVPPGSFTALIGPSGSGKTTLLSALIGARPPSRGQVLLNGVDLYRSLSELKGTLGHVPQEDIVHGELTVAESLDYTARLRLPADTTRAERMRRIADVLAMLELSERRDMPIQRLSGGQRKRVSIATELLTEPNLLFLDEPESGLDPGLEEALMLLLRELSYKGKTVVLVTHRLDYLHLCDSVALLADGRLAFCGTPAEARRHFRLEHLAPLYGLLKEKPAAQWAEEFQRSPLYQQRVAGPMSLLPAPAEAGRERPAHTLPPGRLRQLFVLTARYARTLGRDSRNVLLLLAQAPAIAALIGLSLLYGPVEAAFAKPGNTLLFLLTLTAVWFGCSNAVRELVKERTIYRRERMVNLRVLPYVSSKLIVLSGLSLLQCVMLVVILDRWYGLPGTLGLLLLAMLLAAGVGILLGLAASALAGSADRAATLLPILLIPQVLFTFPALHMDMKGPAGIVARVMPTWWAYDLTRRVALAPQEEIDDETLFRRLQRGETVLLTRERVERMLRAGLPVLDHRRNVEATWTAAFPEWLGRRLPGFLGRWRAAAVDASALAAIAVLLLWITGVFQRRLDRPQ